MYINLRKNQNVKLIPLFITILVILALPLGFNQALSSRFQHSFGGKYSQAESEDIASILRGVDWANVKNSTRFLSSLGSRVLGYQGCNMAADYIITKFKEYGLNTSVHEFLTVAPIDEGSSIYIPSLGLTLRAFALWPRGGIQEQVFKELSGKVYYAEEGTLESLNGVDFSDAIVILDFNSEKNWLKAISLGAKAVIFLEPPYTDKFEALAKGTAAPLNAYLLYVGEMEGRVLKQLAKNHETIIISSSLRWKQVVGKNIVGKLYGDSKEDVIILSTHYDSWSIVPGVSPSSEEAVSTAVLLEIARLFTLTKPKKSIWFIAYSGHWEGATGAFEFAEDILLTATDRIWLQIAVDISSETPYVDFLYFHQLPFMTSQMVITSWTVASYGPILSYLSTMASRFGWIQSVASSELSSISLRQAGILDGVNVSSLNDLVKYNFVSEYYMGTQPDMIYLLDTMAMVQSSGMGFTIRTQYARRISWLTPLDNYNLINWMNVKPQVYLIAATLFAFSNREDFGLNYDTIRPRRLALVGQAPLGLAILYGKTVEFSSDTGWYKPIPHAIVRLSVFPIAGLEHIWPFMYRYTISDENGSFVCHGLVPLTYWAVDAWKFDDNGNVEYAIDQGYTGTSQGISGGISNVVYMTGPSGSLLIPLFNCRSLTFFGILDIGQMRRLQVPDIRGCFIGSGAHTQLWVSYFVNTFESASKTFPVFVSSSIYSDGIAIVYVRKGETVTFTANIAGGSWPQFVVTNSTEENPEGVGMLVNENIRLNKTELQAVKDIIKILENRYKNFKWFEIKSPYVEYALEGARRYLNLATYSADHKLWTYYYSNITLALNLAYKGYSNALMPLFLDSSNSVVVLAFFIIPFSILFERVVLRLSSVKRVLGIFGIAGLLFLVFATVHPAFTLMTNAYMSIIGVGIILLLVFVVLILLREMSDLARRYAISKMGFHEYRGEAMAAVIHTMETAAENIRRRPTRSILMFLTISIFTSGLIALTSSSYTYGITTSESLGRKTFSGILIKRGYGAPGVSASSGILDQPMVELLEAAYSQSHIISPRVWLYPQYVYPIGNVLRISKAGNYVTSYTMAPSAILGISETELDIVLSNFSEVLYPMLLESQVVLPKGVVDWLNSSLLQNGDALKIGDKIEIWGYGNFTLAGTVNIRTQIADPDGYFWLPIDPGFSSEMSMSTFLYPSSMPISPLNPNNIVIMNWKTALKFGGFISSVALIPKEGVSLDKTKEIALQLVDSLPLGTSNAIWLSAEDKAVGMLRVWGLSLIGGAYVFTIVITVLSILNFMLGTLQERRREIFTYQSVGLSPIGALLMFITEITTITLGGVLLGYLLGLGLDRLFIAYRLLPPEFSFNFISFTVFISIVIVVGSTALVSLYPAMLASKMITPSYERKWKPETKPRGNTWELSFPLVVSDKVEAIGILNYMKEYFSEAGYASSGHRVTKIGNVDREKLSFDFEVVLTPMETGVTQKVELYFRELPDERKQFATFIELITGDRNFFASRNYNFLDLIRNQILLWRSLPEEDRNRYMSLV